MIQLRCPDDGCVVDVADMLGATVYCPHCQRALDVDAHHHHVQADPPVLSLSLGSEAGAEPSKPAGPEDGLYAGMPPLAIMLGVREGRGPHWKDEHGLRKEMTANDWKALAAFEKVLEAAGALKASLWFGGSVAFLTLLIWSTDSTSRGVMGSLGSGRLTMNLATAALFAIGFAVMMAGGHRLRRVRIGPLVELATLAAFGVALVFVANVAHSVLLLVREPHTESVASLALPMLPFQVVAAFSAVWASLLIQRALVHVQSADIRSRLVEALECLEQWNRRHKWARREN
jgi:hypothetical protein